jgi:DNA-binding MarR family transcriptional regulator
LVDALYTQFDAVFFEKTRLSLMTVLYREEESSFSRLKQLFGLTDGAAYSHLRKLVEIGYVEQTRRLAGERAETWYTLSDKGRQMFRSYLDFLESITGADEPKGKRK